MQTSPFSVTLESDLRPLRRRYDGAIDALRRSGRFGLAYPALLVETYHYVKHSCDLMERAAAALTDEFAALRAYLLAHCEEERGHERWLLEDLAALGYDRAAAAASIPLAETASLVGRQLYVIDFLHPAGLLGYVYVMESKPPTRRWLETLRDEMGINERSLTFLERHGDADVVHRLELAEALDLHFSDPAAREAARTSALYGLDSVVALFERLGSGDFLDVCPLTPSPSLPSEATHV